MNIVGYEKPSILFQTVLRVIRVADMLPYWFQPRSRQWYSSLNASAKRPGSCRYLSRHLYVSTHQHFRPIPNGSMFAGRRHDEKSERVIQWNVEQNASQKLSWAREKSRATKPGRSIAPSPLAFTQFRTKIQWWSRCSEVRLSFYTKEALYVWL
jgi:hypothetical protein